MHSDSFFYKGKTHDVCEDYAISILEKQIPIESQIPIAIVCDGCSSASNTDFGARVIAKVAASNVRLLIEDDPELFGSAVINSSRRIVNYAGWEMGCLDATLLIAASTKDHTNIFVAGDGVVVLAHDNESYTVFDVTYPSGAPRYLNYWHNQDRIDAYQNIYGETRVINSHHFSHNQEVGEPLQNISDTPFWNIKISNSEFERVVLLSDGVHSFQRLVTGNGKTYQQVPMLEVLQELIAFKGMKGEFVKRRVKRFAKQTEWENNDDVSVAAICLTLP